MAHDRLFDRRGFLALVSASAAGLNVCRCLPHVDGDWSSCRAADAGSGLTAPVSHRVVEVRSAAAIGEANLSIEPEVVRAMLQAGLLALTGTDQVARAWGEILPALMPGERVAIKVNTLNQSVPTAPALVAALAGSLQADLGLAASDLYAWDRTRRELERAGIVDEQMGIPCVGTFRSASDTTGPGYATEAACLSGRKIHLARLLGEAQHLINAAVLKNHLAAGFTGCLKNHYGSFDIPYEFHAGSSEHIALLNAMPAVSGTTRLCVVDALRGVCLGDTDRPADCVPKRILLSFDPVAIDQRALEIRDLMRRERGLEPGPPAGYLQRAEALGLGSTAYELVELSL